MKRTAAIDDEEAMAALAGDMRRVAAYGFYTGRIETPDAARYFRRCTQVHRHGETPIATRLIFTRDAGMHDCGWWKNPTYNQCLHLSLSFFDCEGGFAPSADRIPWYNPAVPHVSARGILPQRRDLADRWIELFYGDWKRLLWAEPPFSPDGKLRDVWHYRVFTDPTFAVPLLPQGEVYSRELTERGWKSWSDLHGEAQESAHT